MTVNKPTGEGKGEWTIRHVPDGGAAYELTRRGHIGFDAVMAWRINSDITNLEIKLQHFLNGSTAKGMVKRLRSGASRGDHVIARWLHGDPSPSDRMGLGHDKNEGVVVMTPREYAFATPSDLGGKSNYRRFCRLVGLQPVPDGWGFLLCEDVDGNRWTRVTADVDYLRTVISAPHAVLSELELPAEKFPNTRAGWPDEWAGRNWP